MIDIHSHLLSGIDDGAYSTDESVRLCSIAADNRIKTTISTPHLFSYDKIDKLYDQRNELIAALNSRLKAECIPVDIKGGFEVYCSERFRSLTDFKRFTLNGSRYILLEFDFAYADIYEALKCCDYVSSFGLVPIIAHPERYKFFLDDYDCFNSFSSRNVLFQINAGSFSGHYGHL